MPSTTSKIVAQYECREDQIPARLYRVRYSGNPSLKARAKPSFKSPNDFKATVEAHLTWCSCEPTPFVSLFASKDHAMTWAQHLLEHGYRDVILLDVDSGRLGPLFRVRDLVENREIRTTLPEHLYEDEYLVLRKIPKRSVVSGAGVLRVSTVEHNKPDSKRMAEALYHLGDSLAWSPTSAPRGQLVLLQDCVEAGGAFLVHHFASLFLKTGHRVCFVAGANTPEHYAAVGRKLGVNFAACQTKKQLQVLDWTKLERGEGWATLFDKLKSFVDQEDGSGVSIVLDDVSALKWTFGDAAVLDFVRCCKTLTQEKNGAANVVLLSHADTDLPGSRPLSLALADMATVVLTTKPLTTGYSKDIHGTLSVSRQSQGLSGSWVHEEPTAIPYKILESTVKCFHSGGEALRWN
ncbi:elongator complex protein 6 [Phytophthora cinnamomi]|uniref:elongator complex protein 6 n=1 Tax=Phytophthora cinnamomi TaxID=4785 RepID=UPI00355A8B19|nr:elongator complex protein 6 [Phytophthora cinnamomi]